MIKIYEYLTVNISGKRREYFRSDSDTDELEDAQYTAKTKSMVYPGICVILKFNRLTEDRKLEYYPLLGEGYKQGVKFDWHKEIPPFTITVGN